MQNPGGPDSELAALVFDVAPDAMFVVEESGRIILTNRAAERVFGYGAGELFGLSIEELVPERARAVHRNHRLDYGRSPHARPLDAGLDLHGRRKDGSEFPADISLTPVNCDGKRLTAVAVRDTAARRRTIESERRYRLLFDKSPLAKWLWDVDSLRFIDVNEEAVRHYGYTREEFLALRLTDLMPDRTLPPSIVKLVKSGQRFVGQDRHRKKDGSVIDVEVTGEPLALPGHRARLAVVHDITDRKRAENALRLSESRYRRLADSGLMLVTYSDAEGRILEVNDYASTLLGFTREELLSCNWRDLTAPESLAAEDAAMAQLRATGVARPWEKEFLRKDGGRIPVLAAAALVDGSEGVGIAFDLTSLKRAERELAASEERFRQLAAAIREVFWLIDLGHNQMLYVSPAYETIWGRSCASLYAAAGSWLDAVHPEDRNRVAAALLTRQPAGTYDEQYRIVRPDGTLRWIRDRAFPVRDASGRVTRAAGVAEDITERRALEDQLRQAQKMEAVGRLAGGVAHDFNNILSVIISYAELIQREAGSSEPVRDDLEEILQAAQRAVGLTRQLLMFSRQQVLEPKVIDLNEVVEGMSRMVARLVGEDVELAWFPDPAIGGVKADRSSIEQVIMNLVVNARDAMPTGGKLSLETANVVLDEQFATTHVNVKPGNYVMLAVSDTGIGMDKETQAHIFEPFFTTKEMGKGTGLGLSTVFGIVQQSGGSVWVYSEPAKGTTFKVYLPRAGEELDSIPSLPVQGWRGTETVLVVEDEAQVRAVIVGVLGRHGYTVLEARDADEALLACERHAGPIHLLLTDVVMPQMSGPELARRLLAARRGMKVLCMSGYTDDSIVRHGMLQADLAFLQKPFTIETLTRKVREVLDQRER